MPVTTEPVLANPNRSHVPARKKGWTGPYQKAEMPPRATEQSSQSIIGIYVLVRHQYDQPTARNENREWSDDESVKQYIACAHHIRNQREPLGNPDARIPENGARCNCDSHGGSFQPDRVLGFSSRILNVLSFQRGEYKRTIDHGWKGLDLLFELALLQ